MARNTALAAVGGIDVDVVLLAVPVKTTSGRREIPDEVAAIHTETRIDVDLTRRRSFGVSLSIKL